LFFDSLVLHHEISIAKDVIVKLYYEEFPLKGECSPIKLKEQMEKAME
jgi:hypothetical protein